MSGSLRPHGLLTPRILSPWDSQARILEWVAISFSRDILHPGIEPTTPMLEGGFFTTEPPKKNQL